MCDAGTKEVIPRVSHKHESGSTGGTKVQTKNDQSNLTSDGPYIKRIRQLRGLSIKEASQLLGCSVSTIKRRESKKSNLSKKEIETFLQAYGTDYSQYVNLKLGKNVSIENLNPVRLKKIIEHKHLRRSYKKIISKEVEVLAILRKRLGISIQKACKLCGYNRSSIGAIENGRINLTENRVKHIVTSYGYKMKDYNNILTSKIDRIEIENLCVKKIQRLSDKKIETLSHLINNL